jgi:hypothetical protein
MGLKLVIPTDAHRPEHLGFTRFGLYQARRGWLEAKNVLNARRCRSFVGCFDERRPFGVVPPSFSYGRRRHRPPILRAG